MALNFFKFLNKGKGQAAQEEQAPKEQTPAEKLAEGMINVRDVIAPSAIEVDFDHVRVGNSYYRTIFVSGYPRFVGANWLSPVINFDHSLDISMFYYPVKSKMILDDLRRKITELEATMMASREKGKITDPVVSAALDDAKALQDQLVKGVEKYFQFSFYITIPADTLEELNVVSSKLESTLGSLLLITKVATLQMEDAFQSSIPAGMDKLMITRNMDTTSLATTFPFTSSDLTMDEGIMYGINRHNGSLVIFDRFSMENANTVVFAKSGAGKSYFVKLEALRLMIFGAEVMIIDPEEEYRMLCETVGGNYIDFSANSPAVINPFDLSGIAVEGENELGIKILSLMTLFKLMLNGLSQTEEAILDRALMETYRLKGITTDPDTQMSNEPPVMEDLYKVLLGAAEPEARNLAERLERFIKGSMTGIFDKQSTININNKMTVFSTKNLEDSLRPIAFYIILDFVWTRIRRDLRKRVLIVEEAWYLMANEDSAKFIYGIAKRARKYYLGLTTITQDVDDFLRSEYGKAIVSNSSIHVLFKQHPSAIDRVAQVFYLSEGEKRLLLAAGIGEGLFFAGANHVSIKVMASPEEHNLVTTNPEELLKLREQGVIATPKSGSRVTFGTVKKDEEPEEPQKTLKEQLEGPPGSRVPPVMPPPPPEFKPPEEELPVGAVPPPDKTEPAKEGKTEYVYDKPDEGPNQLDIELQKEDMATTKVPDAGDTGEPKTAPKTKEPRKEPEELEVIREDQKKEEPKEGEEDHMPTAKDILESVEDLVPDTTPHFDEESLDKTPSVMNTPGHIMRRKKEGGATSNTPKAGANTPLTANELAPAEKEPKKGFSFPNPFAKKESMLEDTVPVQEEEPAEQPMQSAPQPAPQPVTTPGGVAEEPLVNPKSATGQMTPRQAVQQAAQFKEAKEAAAAAEQASAPQPQQTAQPGTVGLDQQEASGTVSLEEQTGQPRPLTSNEPL